MDEETKICRVCLENVRRYKKFSDILTQSEEDEFYEKEESSIASVFQYCIHINLEEENESKTYLCLSCTKTLRSSYDFIRRALESDKKLRPEVYEEKEELLMEVLEEEEEDLEEGLKEDIKSGYVLVEEDKTMDLVVHEEQDVTFQEPTDYIEVPLIQEQVDLIEEDYDLPEATEIEEYIVDSSEVIEDNDSEDHIIIPLATEGSEDILETNEDSQDIQDGLEVVEESQDYVPDEPKPKKAKLTKLKQTVSPANFSCAQCCKSSF